VRQRRRSHQRSVVVLVAVLIIEALAAGSSPSIAAAGQPGPTISGGSVRAAQLTADLRSLAARGPVRPSGVRAPKEPAASGSAASKRAVSGATGAERAAAASAPVPAPLTSFAGLDKAGWGAGYPPDPVGDVGPIYFVQAVNTSIGIFRKSDGVRVAALTFDQLWSLAGTGTACDTSHEGDPTVVYDSLADRWIVADFAFANFALPPYYECIAVSKNGDPVSGGWWMYALRTDDVAHPWFADYPKMGVWPDGLYMTANMFLEPADTFMEPRIWALNRGDMEAGAPARFRVVDLNTPGSASLLPSNMRSSTGAPPAGRENFLIGESESVFGFELFKFHVDYTGSGSTFLGPTVVPQTAYFVAPATVPTPGTGLDSLRERLMMQAQYTNLSGVESVWVQHTVLCCGAGTSVGIQWAQLGVTGGTIGAAPIQQQLYPGSNDGLNRWMGSLALDRNGDMALGYSAANASTMPDIRYAGRLAGDPLGTLPQTETTMLPGITRGTQSGLCGGATCTRWGDYSAMSLDPDGCTFWYTNEYYATTGLNWQTRIGSFRFPSCTVAAPTIASVSPASGPPAGGTPVTITGTGFSTSAGTTVVRFGANAATGVICATTISCAATSPAGSGVVDVSVTVAGATSSASAADQFAYAVSAGTYEDASSAVVATGGWATWPDPQHSGGSAAFNHGTGAGIGLTYSGSAVTVVYSMLPISGIATVTIDGSVVDQLDMYAAGLLYQQLKTYTSPAGTHTVTVAVSGTKNAASAEYYIVVDAFIVRSAVTAGTYQDSDGALVASGGWAAWPDPQHSGGTARFNAQTGASIGLTYSGSAVTVVYAKLPISGIATVTIDGSVVDQLDMYAAGLLYQQQKTYAGAAGIHNITLTVSGTKNAASAATYIVVDAFVVRIAVPAGTFEDSNSALVATGGWATWPDVQHSGGTAAFNHVTGASIGLTYTGSSVTLVYAKIAISGIATVTIDGAVVDQLDMYTAGLLYQQQKTYTGAFGVHTVTVTVSGTKNAASVEYYVVVDAFLIS